MATPIKSLVHYESLLHVSRHEFYEWITSLLNAKGYTSSELIRADVSVTMPQDFEKHADDLMPMVPKNAPALYITVERTVKGEYSQLVESNE